MELLIDSLVTWCNSNRLKININKINELVVDYNTSNMLTLFTDVQPDSTEDQSAPFVSNFVIISV